MFVPNGSTAGHYQIESRCDLCHSPFGGVQNDKCLKCHEEELKSGNDSHALGKFADPRNAESLSIMNARECRTCHQEHRPAATLAGGATQPADHCFVCHQNIRTQRPSHASFSSQGCATTGCHKYHDNTALYEDFISTRLQDVDTLANGKVSPRKLPERRPVTAPDAGGGLDAPLGVIEAWKTTTHASSGVNCSGCHSVSSQGKPVWSSKVSVEQCGNCHQDQVAGFFDARHGMRMAEGLLPMKTGDARQAMKSDSAHRTMTCSACHAAHEYDTRKAAVDSCLQCHNDNHSVAYVNSPHFTLWKAELEGKSSPGTGVSCATCHLPREKIRRGAETIVTVQHNPNANLRPNEKMIRTVCLDCHGFEFSASALADVALVENNFAGRPALTNESVKMVARRLAEQKKKQESK